ncbi:glycosyltransferase family 9 protein [Pedobacter montanisoli]|uniref:Glycosyltransferase family 9 protein n=1 Tax=Pedobacter montanisoli TaxID=2923277 RepID=A0ABS9ZX76_9SPHI|nr:glycosyltransferase family 9 protein [Pedobacter montanisoli]MCJ0742926.1 glycosyltransferase family 9 protein [Pedobacter montanisoli]
MPTKKIIVLRFSAMGDVAMVASVLKELVEQNADIEIVMVSRKAFAPFFNTIDRLSFHTIDPKGEHKGFWGLYKLFKALRHYQPYAIADLHDNIRSRVISAFFRLSGTKIKRIDKGRAEKKALTRKHHKQLVQLKPTVERYAYVFRALHFKIKLSHQLQRQQTPIPANAKPWFDAPGVKRIGIAPFAQHIYKVYPLVQMEEVIAGLNKLGYEIFIFGGGKKEAETALQWEQKFEQVHNTIGLFSLTEELNLIAHLDVMLSMDSSGMHMASLMGIPVVSIWGPTHPYAGFLGYGQSINDCIQIDHPNRPNSIYGNKPCLCGVKACIDLIEPEVVIQKIKSKLENG